MQALKNLFTKKQLHQSPQIESTFDHSKLTSSDDVSQCPFMKNKQQTKPSQHEDQNQVQNKCPVQSKDSKKQKQKQTAQSSDSQQQTPKGGCPFMGGSQRKRNPDLYQQPNLAYDEPFVSKFNYYLSANKIDLTMLSRKDNKVQPISRSRQVFNTYPIYLQHSLFFNGEDYKKVRGLECCSRFLPYEKLREKGNKYFNKGDYGLALDYYQRALSLFKWLEYYEEEDDKKSETWERSRSSFSSMNSSQMLSQNGSKVHINLQEEKEQEFNKDQQLDEMKTKYKQFFVIYTDGNVKLCDGQEMEDAPDIDMRRSLMLQVLLNMNVAYCKLGHFSVALQCIEDCLKLSDKVSQVYLRKAQTLIFNQGCSLKDAHEARQCMIKALELKQSEKIFQSGENILKMVNLHNAQQSYQKTLDFINERIESISGRVESIQERLYQRAKEINEVEKRIISEGKTPYERNEESMEKSKEFKILERMREKYVKVIEFYTEAQNKEQVALAKKEMQELLRVFAEMEVIIQVQVEEKSDELGGLQSEKIQRRLQTIKKSYCEQIYNSGKFNFTVMEWAIKEIIKEERLQEEARKKQEQRERMANGQVVEEKIEKGGYLKMASWGLLVIPIVGILVNQFLIV